MRNVVFEGQSVTPGKVLCVGKNYAAHIAEMNSAVPEQMVVFMKPNTAIGTTLYAVAGETLHYEGEISLLVQDGGIAGVGFGLDLTKRQTQSKLKAAGLPWERAKAFDGAALFSDFVTAPSDLNRLALELYIDGVLRQQGSVDLMLHPLNRILAELQTFVTLDDGDIIMTGTPSGVGAVEADTLFSGRLLDGDRELVRAEWRAQG